MKKGDFKSRIDAKPPLNEKSGREKLERKLGSACWRGRGPKITKFLHQHL